MSDTAIITPNQILEGYKQRKLDFLQVDWTTGNKSQNKKAQYHKIKLWVKVGVDYKWVEGPDLVAKNVIGGRMKNYNERDEMSSSGKRPTTTFRKTSTYKRDKDGGIEKFGEAICAISEAFVYQASKAKEEGKIQFIEGQKIYSPVQTKAKSKESDALIELSNPVIRIQIPFRESKERRGDICLNCDIYDLRKQIPDAEFKKRLADPADPTKEGDIQCEKAEVDGEPINIDNIHKFFPAGTHITGFIALSDIAISMSGVSFPLKWKFIIAKPGSGAKHVGGALFNNMLGSLLEDASNMEISEDQLIDEDDVPEVSVKSAPVDDDDDGVPEDLSQALKEAEE